VRARSAVVADLDLELLSSMAEHILRVMPENDKVCLTGSPCCD
jgi:hypothetical protein